MITPSHIVFNLVILGKKKHRKILLAIVLGAIFPDVCNFFYYTWNGIFRKIPHDVLWGDMYFHSAWTPFFQLSHSFWLLPLMLALAFYWKKHWAKFFWGSALLHSIMDFTVHHTDAYRHFYPFSDWIFKSPISYWDPMYYGLWVSGAEMFFALTACVIIFRRAKSKTGKTVALLAAICFLILFGFGLSQGLLHQRLMGG